MHGVQDGAKEHKDDELKTEAHKFFRCKLGTRFYLEEKSEVKHAKLQLAYPERILFYE